MAEKKLLNIKEASGFLKKDEDEIRDLVKREILPAYQIGGMYLRFKREHLEKFKNSPDYIDREQHQPRPNVGIKDKFLDSIYFNDFYILTALIIIALFILILRNIL